MLDNLQDFTLGYCLVAWSCSLVLGQLESESIFKQLGQLKV